MPSEVRHEEFHRAFSESVSPSNAAGPGTGDRLQGSTILSLKEAAAYLQVSKAHLSNLINGKVPGVPSVRFCRMGRRILIRREWIDEWIETTARADAN